MAKGKIMQFNEGQATAINELGQLLKFPGVYGLMGGSGRGKTTVFQQIIKEYIEDYQYKNEGNCPAIKIIAPTNKAVRVARQMGELCGIHDMVNYSTIHSLLGLRVDEEEGKKSLKKTERDIAVEDYDVIVVDEASMVNKDLVGQFLDRTNNKVAVLGVMDEYQLPPVGEALPTFLQYFEKTYKLTENMRQGDSSPHGLLVEDCLQAVIKGRANYDPRHNSELFYRIGRQKGSWLLSNDDFNRTMLAGFKAAFKADKLDQIRLIAFFHNTIEKVNGFIREEIFGQAAINEPFLEGEPLIALSPVERREWHDRKNKIVKQIVVSTSAEMRVINSHKFVETTTLGDFEETIGTYTYDVWKVLVQIGNETIRLNLPDFLTKKQWNEDCNKLKAAAKNGQLAWRYYYQLREVFDDVRVAYGITTYSSQGSTFKTVFVPGGDMRGIKNFDIRNRSWYVATGRASEKIILC